MIHLEMTNSPDSMSLGLYDFNFDKVFIGRSKKNDLIINDTEMPLEFLQIHIHKDKHGEVLMIQSLTEKPYFYHNQKKVHGSIRLRVGDVISFGKNDIKVVDFKKTQKEDDLSEQYEKFNTNSPELGFVLNFIEEKIIELESSNSK